MRAAVVVGVLMIAFAVGAPAKHVPAKPNPSKATISYPGTATAQVMVGSTAYKLVLDVEPTARGTVSDIKLVLTRAGTAGDANLLDPPGTWHGYQPYSFAATDFKAGAAQSLYGANRTVCRFATGLVVAIAVKQVAVEQIPATIERRFTALVLDVAVTAAPLVDGLPACP